jgi:NCAIR mutase (PurE)-related protein
MEPAEPARALGQTGSRDPFELAETSFARFDLGRGSRQKVPEAILALGKSPDQVVTLVERCMEAGVEPLMVTRAPEPLAQELAARFPGADLAPSPGGTFFVSWRKRAPTSHVVAVVAAGTADAPAAEECLATLSALGLQTRFVPDSGVAGLHRILTALPALAEAQAVVVVAGMDAALPSVVAGLYPGPVVAVPTSAGYGASMNGVTPLLAMLSSCVPGLAVVGIDNGFGAACAVARMLL